MGDEMFRYMNYAYAVYKEKSFTKAAEKLFISQPSLSLTIKKLEDALGCPVFERSGREISLTAVGEKYIEAAEAIMKIEGSFKNELDDVLNLKKGKIVIGSTIFISSYILPQVLRRFNQKYPYIDVAVVVEQSTVLEQKLENGEVDLIIDNAVYHSDAYVYIPVLEEKILLGVPENCKANEKNRHKQISEENIKDDRFINSAKISISEFADDSFVLLKTGNKMRKISDAIFAESGVKAKTAMEFDQLMTAVSYAENGFGICFLTDTILKYAKGCKGLCYYAPDTEHSSRMLYIIYKKNRYLTCASAAFIEEFNV